jgi:hypothetical protein
MTRVRPLLAGLLVLAPAVVAMAEPQRLGEPALPKSLQEKSVGAKSLGASSGASAAQEPPEPAPAIPLQAPQARASAAASPERDPVGLPRRATPVANPKPPPAASRPAPVVTGTVAAGNAAGRPSRPPSRPLAGIGMVHVEVLPLQGDAEKCGLDATVLQPAATYPIAASARLKVGRATLTHMHIRLSAVYVRRLEHCMLHADVRVSSLQQVELQHSKANLPAYVPLWEKTDIRLVPRGLTPKLAQDRLKLISEQFLIDWSGQN